MGFIQSVLCVAMIALLSGCAQHGSTTNPNLVRTDVQSLPDDYSLFHLGGVISDYMVHVFDPWLDTFDLPILGWGKPSPLSQFSPNPYMLVRDDDVVIYSMHTQEEPDARNFFEVIDDVREPVPLIEGE